MKNIHLIAALLFVSLYACNIIELEPKEDKVGKLLAQKSWVVVRSEDSINYPEIGSVYQFSEHIQTIRKKNNPPLQKDSISVSPSEIRILTPPRSMSSVSIYHFDEDTLVITRGKNDDKSVYLLPIN
ncbi:hypothetical protein [Polluticaenibacter yanchengensis]|uniref:Lipoprotein n=1 Tax=Polluticaenibacter yanchengensis TaxID=3014562 RepID=A0ABT4UIC1_9BACT|nr:hypothetical protein [Chitinophagaceae bacterium LY-5]